MNASLLTPISSVTIADAHRLRGRVIGIALLFFLCMSNCVVAKAARPTIKIVTWNLQTFFDCVADGTEFSEFRKKSTWTVDRYKERLARLTQSMLTLNADILVFEEIEKAEMLYDISNALDANTFFTRKRYRWGCFTKESGSAFGIAVLSCYPIESSVSHSIAIATEQEAQPSLRPLLEAHISVSIGKQTVPLILFANHWKSQRDGELFAHRWQYWQQTILQKRMQHAAQADPHAIIIACGDFNVDITKETAMTYFNPWIEQTALGSYYYQGQWERLDHFMFVQRVHYVSGSFTVECDGKWVMQEGLPNAYRLYTGMGYSDHMPISCKVYVSPL